MIALVRQREAYDCAVAALAMLSGKTYEESLSFWKDHNFTKDGISDRSVEILLADWGFAIRPLWRFLNNVERAPWPPLPFAPAHLVQVRVKADSPVNHYVVLLKDGSVLDPLCDERKTLSDYAKVNHVVGVYVVPGE